MYLKNENMYKNLVSFNQFSLFYQTVVVNIQSNLNKCQTNRQTNKQKRFVTCSLRS